MYITKHELVELKACTGGLKRFIKQTNGTDEPVKVLSLIGGRNTISDLVWLAGKKLDKKSIVQFAITCVESVLPLFEDDHPDDKRPRLAIESAKNWLSNPSSSNETFAAEYAATDAAAYAATDAVATAYVAAAYAAADADYATATAYIVDTYAAAYAADASSSLVNDALTILFKGTK